MQIIYVYQIIIELTLAKIIKIYNKKTYYYSFRFAKRRPNSTILTVQLLKLQDFYNNRKGFKNIIQNSL